MISAAELHTLVTLLATLSFTSTSLSEMHVGKAAVHMAAGELYRRVRVFQSAARKHFAFQCTKFLKTNLHSHICACYKKGKKSIELLQRNRLSSDVPVVYKPSHDLSSHARNGVQILSQLHLQIECFCRNYPIIHFCDKG